MTMEINKEDILKKIFQEIKVADLDISLKTLVDRVISALSKAVYVDDHDEQLGNPVRVYLGGSLSKNTAVKGNFDINIVVFLQCPNGYQQFCGLQNKFFEPTNEALKHLLQNDRDKINKNVKNQIVQADLQGMVFKIYPGLTAAAETTVDDQYHYIIEMAKLQDDSFTARMKLQFSMIEIGDEFVRQQNFFTHQVIVLLKCLGKEYLSQTGMLDLSCILELIAIHVVQQLIQTGEQKTLLSALKTCLDTCIDILNCKIQFENGKAFEERNYWQNWNANYIRDPVNHMQNRLPRKNLSICSKFSGTARSIKQNLERSSDLHGVFGIDDKLVVSIPSASRKSDHELDQEDDHRMETRSSKKEEKNRNKRLNNSQSQSSNKRIRPHQEEKNEKRKKNIDNSFYA